jgi:hypothetical protein
MKYVITSVHGTWPDTNGLVAPGSSLRRTLLSLSSSDNVTFREFLWTGANTHEARTEAGARLAQFLRDGHAQHPDARHYVIAHSHGGNVALYAMRDPAAREIVSGIVTLATPFIHARRRDPGRYADVIAWLMLAAAALLAFVALDALALPLAGVVWLIASVLLMVTMKPVVARWLVATASDEQDAIVSALQPPVVDRSKLLILCARGDEASRWLRAWDVVAKAPFAIGCVLLTLVQVASRANLPVMADGFARSTLHRGLEELRLFGFDGWSLGVGGIVLCVVWAAVLLFSSVIRWPGLLAGAAAGQRAGRDRDRQRPRADDGNAHQAHTFDVPPQTMRSRITRELLRHTAICDYPAVVAAVRDWMATEKRLR